MILTPDSAEPPHRDRFAGLVFFGIVEILLGGLTALLVPLMLMAAIAGGTLGGSGSTGFRFIVPNLVIYTVIAGVFIWLGIGSIRARRWARELMLVISWLWLLTGVAAMIVSWWLIPTVWSQLGATNGLPREAVLMVQLITTLFIGFVYILLPLAFVLFYRSEHVAATCRVRDPSPSWTDDCPPHILSLVMIYAFAIVSVLVVPAYGFFLPFFGLVLRAWPGALAWFGVLCVLVYLVRATARRDPRAWQVAVWVSVVAAVAQVVTFLTVPLAELVAAMELPPDQMLVFNALGNPEPRILALLALVVWGSWLVYLIYAKRFFVRADSEG